MIILAHGRLQTPPTILLVLTGVVLVLIPGLPPVILAPNFVLLNDLYRLGRIKNEARRRIERELDLREVQITNAPSEQ
jgi:hypothetical protein